MTTTFFKRATRLAPGPAPVAVVPAAYTPPAAVWIMPTPTPVPPTPKSADLESLGPIRFRISTPQVDLHSTEEEKRGKPPASLVGGL